MSRIPPKKKPSIPKATVRGDARSGFHISTRDDPKPKQETVNLPLQAPPQAKALVNEYVDSLEKQLYLVNAELRFAKDRACVDMPPDTMSVDSAIRRLRMAYSMHEEETLKKITELQNETQQYAQKIQQINQDRALEVLDIADEREIEEMKSLEEAFVEFAQDINLQALQKAHYEEAKGFFDNQRNSIQQGYDTLKNQNAQEDEDYKTLLANIMNLKRSEKNFLDDINESIRNKRLQEEKYDFFGIENRKPKAPPPNIPLPTLNAKNAKLEYELKAVIDERGEMERQVDVLLEKNVQLKAEYNEAKARVEEARRIKAETDKMCTAKYNLTKQTNDNQRVELAQMKQSKREMKQEIEKLLQDYSEKISEINNMQNQKQMLTEVINYKNGIIQEVSEANEQSKVELNILMDSLTDLRKELDETSHQIAKASEKLRNVQVISEINSRDKRCSLENVPPELTQLLETLVAVKGKIV